MDVAASGNSRAIEQVAIVGYGYGYGYGHVPRSIVDAKDRELAINRVQNVVGNCVICGL